MGCGSVHAGCGGGRHGLGAPGCGVPWAVSWARAHRQLSFLLAHYPAQPPTPHTSSRVNCVPEAEILVMVGGAIPPAATVQLCTRIYDAGMYQAIITRISDC